MTLLPLPCIREATAARFLSSSSSVAFPFSVAANPRPSLSTSQNQMPATSSSSTRDAYALNQRPPPPQADAAPLLFLRSSAGDPAIPPPSNRPLPSSPAPPKLPSNPVPPCLRLSLSSPPNAAPPPPCFPAALPPTHPCPLVHRRSTSSRGATNDANTASFSSSTSSPAHQARWRPPFLPCHRRICNSAPPPTPPVRPPADPSADPNPAGFQFPNPACPLSSGDSQPPLRPPPLCRSESPPLQLLSRRRPAFIPISRLHQQPPFRAGVPLHHPLSPCRTSIPHPVFSHLSGD